MSGNCPPKMTAVDHGIVDSIEWATCRASFYGAINGYVRVPEGHPWHGLDYDDSAFDDVEVNGGLTFSRDGWIGFDTLHAGDCWPGAPVYWNSCGARHWTSELVAEEARSLARQVAEVTA